MKLGKDVFPYIWYKICQAWIIVSIGSLIMVIITWILIMIENTHTFQTTMNHYMGNTVADYGGDPMAGYVDNTNIPKHLGGPVFAAVFDVAMIILCVISLASEVYWRIQMARQVLDMFYTTGLYDDGGLESLRYLFLVANAFLKLFIVAATGAETYIGLNPDDTSVNTPLFCLYSTMILLASIPFTILAQIYTIMELRRPDFLARQGATSKALEEAKKEAGDNKADADKYRKDKEARAKAAEKESKEKERAKAKAKEKSAA